MRKCLICCVIAMTALACNSEKKSGNADMEMSAEAADTLVEKIIKTADMRFRVKDVQSTKEQLSQVIHAGGGTVTEFSIQSDIVQNDKVKYSSDSLLELTSYRTNGYLVARVPSAKLDDFTNKVAKMAVFVDTQAMKMDDQGISYLSNAMKSANKAEAVTQIEKLPAKKVSTVQSALTLKDAYVDEKIANLNIDSKVNYSTITLNFYQGNTVKKLIVANDNLSDFRPAFFKRLGLSIQNGWVIFMEIILVLSNLWVLILIALGGWLFYRYHRKTSLKV